MLADIPIRWTEPATWPRVVYVWLAFVVAGWLAGWLASLWRWMRRRRAAGWPIAEGRIQSVEITKPGFSFTTKRGYHVADLGYSYSVAGSVHAGRYKRAFATKWEAEEFARDLQNKPVAVSYDPSQLASSSLSDADVDRLLQNRAPAPEPEWLAAAGSIPEWIRPLLWPFVWLSAVGLVVSLWVHLEAVMGRRVAPVAVFGMLHVGIFVVWFPAVFVAQRLVGDANRKDFWKAVLKGAPDWMRYMVYGFFAYAGVNFFLFMTQAPSGKGEVNPPASVWRGFSGHWMVFYSAALAILYSAARMVGTSPRCPNGHLASPNAIYCPRCGGAVMRIR